MRLSKIYSNKNSVFSPVVFNSGLNVIVAEMRLPENKSKNTHNLGKTTLGRVIDFCLLAGRDPSFFLFKHEAVFKSFIFYLEVQLDSGEFVTIRRGVEHASKISLSLHGMPNQDYSDLPDNHWGHANVPFERARSLLDGILNLRDLGSYDFRKMIGYLVREQDDFREVFHLRRFLGPHSEWKPFLAHILGFHAGNLEDLYEKEEELKKKLDDEATVRTELGGAVTDMSKIEGMLQIKKGRAEKRQQEMDSFDFRADDKEMAKEVIDELDITISNLTNQRYSLSQNKKRISISLSEDTILFNPETAEQIFKEAGIVFPGQIKKDFTQLMDFNKAITKERAEYLRKELEETDSQIKELSDEINVLSKRRSQRLSTLAEADIFLKYKQATDEVVSLRAEIAALEAQQKYLLRLGELRSEIRSLEDDKNKTKVLIEKDFSATSGSKESIFSKVRILFNEIIADVLGCYALLSVSVNRLGHPEYKAEIVDDGGKATSADNGYSYRKLLCIAFDMALLRAHLSGKFPRFAFHDGVFESFDNRLKLNLLGKMREYADSGIQQIVTLIASDLPVADDQQPVFSESEIVLRLNDMNDQGRLFKMPPW